MNESRLAPQPLPLASERATIHEALVEAARLDPGRVAFTFQTDAGPCVDMTYGTLDGRARAVAAAVQRVAARGDRVALLIPPGHEFIAGFFGCLFAGVIPVPLQLPGARTSVRIAEILAHAAPAAILASRGKTANKTTARSVANVPVVVVEECQQQSRFADPGVGTDDVAFLQYTSGSTGRPRGVIVTHRNLLANVGPIADAFGVDDQSRLVGWLPPYHDMGLVGHILTPVCYRLPTLLMSPAQFVNKPVSWLRAIAAFGATISGGPNAAYQQCVSRIDDADIKSLDLRSWAVAFNGSETVRVATMTSFAQRFGPCGFEGRAFVPCYGLAEATLLVTAKRRGVAALAARPARSIRPTDVSCGTPSGGMKIAIVDGPRGVRCPAGEVGEIWVAGASTSPGYWMDEAATARSMGARLAGTEELYLRTGDLGYMYDGELYVTGRLKDLIICAGANHAPDDVELTTQASHHLLRGHGGAAFAVDTGEEERIVVVQEVGAGVPAPLDLAVGVFGAIAEAHNVVPEAVVLVRRGTLPRTPTGKIQRHACRDRYLAGTLDRVVEHRRAESDYGGVMPLSATEMALDPSVCEPCRTQTEEALAAICAAVLRIDAIGRQTNLLNLGADSLLAGQIMNRVREQFGAHLPVRILFEHRTVERIAAEIDRLKSSAASRVAPPPLVPRQAPSGRTVNRG